MKTIIFKPVLHINTEELDFLLHDNFIDEDEDCIEIYLGDTNHLNDAIKISTLREHLDQLEEKGANYVSILYHGDHREYELDGQEVRLATQQEIDEQTKKKKDYELKQISERVKVLSSELDRYKNKLKELSGE